MPTKIVYKIFLWGGDVSLILYTDVWEMTGFEPRERPVAEFIDPLLELKPALNRG